MPLYLMKPNFLNLFMNWLTRERVVPIISASVSWLTFAMIVSGFPSEDDLISSHIARWSCPHLPLHKWASPSLTSIPN